MRRGANPNGISTTSRTSCTSRRLFIVACLAAWTCTALSSCSKHEPSAAKAPSAGCTVTDGQRVELVVYAATSTRDALTTLETSYERDHDVDLVFNFGGSGDLTRQIVAAGKADVFLSAGEKEMDVVAAAKMIASDTRRVALANQLVVIEPSDAPTVFTSPFDPHEFASGKVRRVSLAQVDTVPAGRYAKAWLENVGVWSAVEPKVLPGVDVRAALAAVESGGADVGVVYRTDVARSTRARIVYAVPVADGPRITYPLAVIAGRPHEARARAFADFLTGPEAHAVFESFGFLSPVEGSTK